jgi:hypothetical protein
LFFDETIGEGHHPDADNRTTAFKTVPFDHSGYAFPNFHKGSVKPTAAASQALLYLAQF